MGFWSEIGKVFKSAGNQVTRSTGLWKYEEDKRVIRFGNKFYESAKNYGVTEDYALDVYYHGTSVGEGKMLRKYNGYEIGIFYTIQKNSGVIWITYTWKKDRL